MAKMYMTQQSSIWEVETSEGTFTVYFPCGVYTKEDKFCNIPKAVRDFKFISTPEQITDKAFLQSLKPLIDKEVFQKLAQANVKMNIDELNKLLLQAALNKAIRFGTFIPQARISLHWNEKKIYVM